MKRLLLSVFAAAITAAWALPTPATAGDIDLSGQYRLRGEYVGNPDLNDNTGDNTNNYLQRVRVNANAQATEDTSVKITLQDSRTWGANQAAGGGPGLTDVGSNHLDLHESYVKIDNVLDQPVSAKIGRQVMVYGDQRLIGGFDWHNNARAFDAIKLTYSGQEAFDVDLFTSKISEGGADNDQDFHGIYATVKSIPNNTLDLYALLLTDGTTGGSPFGLGATAGNTTIGTVSSAQELYTYGLRLNGSFQDLSYTLEYATQSGGFDAWSGTTTKSYDFGGNAWAIRAGYKLPTAMKASVGAEYTVASGDDNASDTDIDTFYNLFPTNHAHMGISDLQGWRNVKAWSVNAKADVNEKLNVKVAYWNFKLAEDKDAWYGAGHWNNTPTTGVRSNNITSATTATGAAYTTEDDIGTEIDIVANYKYNAATGLQLGVSQFSAGDFVSQYYKNTSSTTDKEGDSLFAYLQLTTNF